MPNYPGGFGAPVGSGLGATSTVGGAVGGVYKEILLPAARGYIDASHYSDLNEVVLNDAESTTGWVVSRPTDGIVINLDSAIFTTGSNSINCKLLVNTSGPVGSFYVNLPSDQAVGPYVEVAFDLRTDYVGLGNTMRAFVSTGVDLGGTVVYAADFTLQLPTAYSANDWHTIRVPIAGQTTIRCVGITQTITPASNTSARGFFWMDNVRLREATGFDQAVYSAPAGSHIVIPPGYTTTKTQLPIYREAANVTWEDRRK